MDNATQGGTYYHPDTRTTHQTSGAVQQVKPPEPQVELKIVEHNVQAAPTVPPPITQSFSLLGMGELDTKYTWKLDKKELFFDWTGPKIELAEWYKATAFLAWANRTHKCEAQLRLYFNPQTGEARFWAYPQSIRGGLSTSEYADASHPEYEEYKAQRAQFPEDAGWKYGGTDHSHCDAPAFQSGTDHGNEINIDGWHFTVGKLSSKTVDLHCRLRADGIFIEVGDWKTMIFKLPDHVEAAIKDMPVAREKLLESLIEVKPPDDYPFPEVWKTNMKERPQVAIVSSSGTSSTTYYGGYSQPYQQRSTYRPGMATIPSDWTLEELQKLFPTITPVAIAARDIRINCSAAVDAWHRSPLSFQAMDLVVGLCQTMKQRFMVVNDALGRYRDGLRNGAKNPVIEDYMTKTNSRLEFLILQFETIRKDWDLVDIVNCCEATGQTFNATVSDLTDIEETFSELERAAEAEALKKDAKFDHLSDEGFCYGM
jgi:hypothetical protein